MSVDYYTRLERGNLAGVSDSVLHALAEALQLDDAERAHLADLARAADRSRRPHRRPAQQRVRPSVQRILDAMIGAPAFVLNGRLDILAANELGHALYSELYIDPARPANHARCLFLGRRSADFWGDWDKAADDTVAILRAEAGRDPYDKGLTALIGELSTRSEDFRVRWAAHNVSTTAPAPSASTTPSSASSPSTSSPPGCPPTPVRPCSTTRPSPTPHPLRPSGSWPAGSPRRATHPPPRTTEPDNPRSTSASHLGVTQPTAGSATADPLPPF